MDRRQFLGWMSVGCLASSLPVAIAACSSKPTASTVPTSEAGSDGFQAIGTLDELKAGPILVTQGLPAPALVVRNRAQAIVAVNPKCPHAGCNVKWEAADAEFICPCHDSRFDEQGQVTKGPSKQPLTLYQTKVEGERIMVNQG